MESFQFAVYSMTDITEVLGTVINRMDHHLDLMIFCDVRPVFYILFIVLRRAKIPGIAVTQPAYGHVEECLIYPHQGITSPEHISRKPYRCHRVVPDHFPQHPVYRRIGVDVVM